MCNPIALMVGGALLGGQMYGAKQQRDAMRDAADAQRKQAEDAARKQAEAEGAALVAANAQQAEAKRRRRSNALALGDPSNAGMSLGDTATALGTGGTGKPAMPATSTVLGQARDTITPTYRRPAMSTSA